MSRVPAMVCIPHRVSDCPKCKKPKKPVTCDCLNRCGDDPWLKDGRATPCKARASQQKADRDRARVVGVSRMFDNPKALLLSLDRAPTDDDLRRIHEALR